MTDHSSTRHDASLLPDGIRLYLWRKCLEFAGLAVVCIVLLAAVSLASWSIEDPSINHAVAGEPQNLLGLPGAIVADLAIQLFGLGIIAFLIAPVAWGCLLMSRGFVERFRLRPVFWIAGGLLTAGFFSSLPAASSWPLPSGLGGVVGDIIHDGIAIPLRLVTGTVLGGLLSGILLFIAAIVTVALACALSTGDIARTRRFLREEGADFAAHSAGAAAHGVLRLMSIARRRGAGPDSHLAGGGDLWSDDADGGEWDGGADQTPPASARGGLLRRLFGSRAGRSSERIEPSFGAARVETSRPGPAGARTIPDPSAATVPAAASVQVHRRKQVAGADQMQGDYTGYQLPPLKLLSAPKGRSAGSGQKPADLERNARMLESILEDFGVRGEIINVRPGPVVTLYELEPAPGIKSSRVIGLADDIARSMSAISARVAVVPGRNAIGIELPNARHEIVYLRELLESAAFQDPGSELTLALGKDIGGGPVMRDLTRMPHLLIAGTTGSGKSVGINTMILSLLYRLTPDQCKFIMVDPKMLELSVYDGIPHLLAPVVTDPKKAVVALKWTVREMEERYQKMSKLGVRNIDGYNEKVAAAEGRGKTMTRTVQTGFDHETGAPVFEHQEIALEKMPYIVVIVDEMADLMMVAGKDIEGTIQRLAQMARAAGIHLVTATQRPSVDVITGTIKANFPTRISFQVTSKVDSRTILSEQGAEQLLGRGDMLFMAGGGRISRVHGPFVTDSEVEKVVRYLKKQGVPEYLEAVTEETEEAGWSGGSDGSGSGDDIFNKAVDIVLRDRKASTSYIQRRLSIGYNRAATIIERMEQEGIVSPANHAGKREILIGEDP